MRDRLSADKSRYEKAYNAGEDFVDIILFVEVLVGAVRLLRNIPKLLKNMEKWITEKGKRLLSQNPIRFKSTEELLSILSKDNNFNVILNELKSGKVARAFKKILSIEEEAVLRYYTTKSGYKNLNQALRGEIEITENFLAQEKLMNEALEKLPVSLHNTPNKLLYRIGRFAICSMLS